MKQVKRLLGVIGIVLFFLLIIFISYIFIKNFGTIIENPDELRRTISGYGIWAYSVYFLIYIFQIFFAPVPGQMLNIVSGMLFGPLKGFFLSWGGVILGGLLAMFFTRYLGKKVLYWFLEERALKFEKEITKRGLALIILLAIFPNPIGDGIFYLAGLTAIPLKFLIIMIALCRIPGLAVYVIAGDKILTSGIKGWVIGGIGFLIIISLYFILGRRFERLFEKIITSSRDKIHH